MHGFSVGIVLGMQWLLNSIQGQTEFGLGIAQVAGKPEWTQNGSEANTVEENIR